MQRSYIKAILKITLISLPVIFLFGFYAFLDPFKVVQHYDSYVDSGKFSYIMLNRDFISLETFENNNAQFHYDSFIFGSSRSFFYQAEDWQTFIHSDRCFQFNASSESLYGILHKFKYLSDLKIPIKNALIVIDCGTFELTTDSKGILFAKHPKLTGGSSLLFQLEFFKAFLDREFIWDYLNYEFNGVSNYWPEFHVWGYSTKYNQLYHIYANDILERDSATYYRDKKETFYIRDSVQKISNKTIWDGHVTMLSEIKQILDQNKTNYKIIISPLYDQLKFCPEDIKTLNGIFGADRVFDFSGKNQITNDRHNYYENSHYRPHVARYIMQEIYKNDAK